MKWLKPHGDEVLSVYSFLLGLGNKDQMLVEMGMVPGKYFNFVFCEYTAPL